jgi:hypothetical protein
MLGSLLTNLEELFQRRRDGMSFVRGGKEKSNLKQASTSLRDHEGTITTHLPWKEQDLVERREKRACVF